MVQTLCKTLADKVKHVPVLDPVTPLLSRISGKYKTTSWNNLIENRLQLDNYIYT